MATIFFDDPCLETAEYQEILKCRLVRFFDCRLLRRGLFIAEDLWIENGQILDPEKVFFIEKRKPTLSIDCRQRLIAPGFIDIQINGGFGVDFSSDASLLAENISKVAKSLVQFGVTAFCPTIVSSAPDFYKKALKVMETFEQNATSAICLGLHLEGPFINQEKKGAHADQHFVDGFSEGLKSLTDVYGSIDKKVALITLAPELPGAIDVIRTVSEKGVRVSLGHSSASISIGEEGVRAGASCITHLFNAMLPFHHRDPGLVGLLTSAEIPQNRTLFFGVIADGVHTHDAALRIAHRTHPEGLVLVTDAVALLGFKEGTHKLGDMTIKIENRRALIAGTNTITGSISPLDYCVRHFRKAARCDPSEALTCASLHPAQFLGLETRKGTLHFGSDSDFTILDDNLHILATFIGGLRCWSR